LASFQDEREQLEQLEELFQQAKFIAGLAQADEVTKQFPASFQLRFLKFKFLHALKKDDEAILLLREMHGMFGDNIMILKELGDLNFQQQKLPESLLYYKKLLFLDSFNSVAQERVKQMQGMLTADVNAKLADTKVEIHVHDGLPAERSAPLQPGSPPPISHAVDVPPVQITIDSEAGPGALAEGKESPPPAEDLHFETESAAELYFKQGLYREALAFFKSLFEKTGRTDFFLKIKAILLLLRTDKSNQVIEKLQKFLQLIQQRGSQIV
jgi:tetratricopeptide (TPR) repeat protein